MMLIATALTCEAEPVIKHFILKQDLKEPRFRIYRNREILLIVTGVSFKCMGPLGFIFGKYKINGFLNIGVAGHRSQEIGEPFLIHKASYENRALYPVILFEARSEEICTQLTLETEYRENILYDMETYFMFEVVSKFLNFEKIHALKIVSDNKVITETNISLLIQRNLRLIERTVEEIQKENDKEIEIPLEKDPFDFHFTECQKIRLEEVMKRYRIIDKDLSFLKNVKDPKELISKIEQKLTEFTLCI